MRRVVWAESAIRDLEGVIAFLAERNPTAAQRTVDQIERAGIRLGDMATGRPGRVAGTYEKVVPGLPHILAYAIQPLPDGAELIVILRAIHGARDWPKGKWPE